MKTEEIKKLAEMARIEMNQDEIEEISKDFDPILAYVDQVKEALNSNDILSENKKTEDFRLLNVIREDVVTNQVGQYTEKIKKEMPEREGDFLKVKQVL